MLGFRSQHTARSLPNGAYANKQFYNNFDHVVVWHVEQDQSLPRKLQPRAFGRAWKPWPPPSGRIDETIRT